MLKPYQGWPTNESTWRCRIADCRHETGRKDYPVRAFAGELVKTEADLARREG